MNESKPAFLSLANGHVKDSDSHLVVQKFGGTSVGKFPLNIVEQVVLYVDSSAPLPLGMHVDGSLFIALVLAFNIMVWPWYALRGVILQRPKVPRTGELSYIVVVVVYD